MLLLVILAVANVHQAEGYGGGAPFSTCYTQYPKHSRTQTQALPSPFSITLSPTTYTPGQEVTIQVTDSSGQPFMGIQMAARRTQGNTEEIVGRFTEHPADKLKVFNCFNGVQNMVTHTNNNPVTSLTFKWRAPDSNVGDVVFRSTLLRNFEVFWYGVLSPLPVSSAVSTPVEPSTYPLLSLNTQSSAIDFDSCGDTKGCFYYPRHCSGSDCIAAATYAFDSSTNVFHFELHTSAAADYVSIGFSHDEMMGQDWTITCTGRNAPMTVQEGVNPDLFNMRMLALFSSAREVMYKDGKLQCRFSMPQMFNAHSVIQGPVANFSSTPWDLGQKHYVMVAWGDTMDGSPVVEHHRDLPPVSDSKVDLKANEITYGSSFHVMVKAHAAVMTVAWILLTGLVTVVSRHYRDWLPRTRLCGTQVWFQIHRELAILVLILTAIGMVLIFVHYGSGIRKYADPHAYVGIAVTACVGLQVIAGFLRPDGDSQMRPLFNWGHRFLGHAQHILAAATMFLAFDISYITPDMHRFGFIALAVWVAVQLLWHIVFEVLSRRTNKQEKSESYSMDAGGTKVNTEKPDLSSVFSLVFLFYFLCLAGLCSAVLVAILVY